MPPSPTRNPDLIQLDSDHTLPDGSVARYVKVRFGYDPFFTSSPQMEIHYTCYDDKRQPLTRYVPPRLDMEDKVIARETGAASVAETWFEHTKRAVMSRINAVLP